MANINYLQPKIASWTEKLAYEEPVLVDGVTQTDEFNQPVTETKIKEDPRVEAVAGASIKSIIDVVDNGAIAKQVFLEMRFADGQTTHGAKIIVPIVNFNMYDDDSLLLKALLSEHFNIL